MATYTVDKIAYGGNTYNLQDAGALQLTGGSVTGPVTFGDSVSVDDLSVGTLSTTGNATFANNIQANKINNVTVGSSPKFTDTVTTVTTTGSGNAITAITASNGAITATKGSTFLTSAPVTSVNGKTGAVTLSIPTVPTNVSAFTNDAGYTTNTGTVTGVKVNGTTINPTSGVVDIGTVAASDTKVTQTILAQDASNSYPVLLSDSTSTSESTTGTTFKNSKLIFYPLRDSGSASFQVGNGFEILGRFNFYTDEQSAGTGISIGTESNSQSEMFYRTAGSGQFLMQHWTAEKASDGSPASGSYRDSIINMNTSANNPTIYLYNKSGANTVTSYLRLNANSLYIHDGSAHQLGAGGIDKVNVLGTSTTICKTQHYTSAITGNTWYTFNSFTLAAGTWIVQCSATFNSTSSTGTRIIRLTTGNTSTTRVNWSCEATLGAHAHSMNTLTFTTILTPTASTTYYLRAWSSLDVTKHDTNNSGFVTYTRLI